MFQPKKRQSLNVYILGKFDKKIQILIRQFS